MATAPDAATAAAGRPWRNVLHVGCGGALVILTALVAYVVVGIALWVRAGEQPPRQAQQPLPITGSAAVLRDGATIVYSDPGGLCSIQSLIAEQTATRVVLSLTERPDSAPCTGTRAAGPVVSPSGLGYASYAGTANVTLNSPLGDRRLVDAVTGRTIPYFDQRGALRLLVPGWSPPEVPEDFADFSTSVPYFGGPGAAVLAERFGGSDPGTHQPNGMSLLIVQVAGGGWHPPAKTVTTNILVRGLPGLAAPGIIVWSEDGRTIAIMGEGAYPAGETARTQSGPPLPVASLEAIAGALTRASQA